jgi:ketosteroid isomerase-like protein
MNRSRSALLLATSLALFASCSTPSQAPQTDPTAEIIALERAALDRWNKGEPQGYLDLYAPEITYFDPATARRIDGLEAMKAYYAPITGKIKSSRYDMIAPKVQRYGEVAVLSFQLVSFGLKPDGAEQTLARWNSTAVYRQIGSTWKTAHTHWSYIQPELKTPIGQ